MTGTTAEAVVPAGAGWSVTCRTGSSTRELSADAVVVACQAPAAAPLLKPFLSDTEAAALAVEYASVVLVTYVFGKPDLPTLSPGTGFLVPPSSGRLVKAATYSSQKWGWLRQRYRDQVVVRVSMGRFGDDSVWARDDDDLCTAGLAELQEIVATAARPMAAVVTRWPKSLPQYPVGHRARVAALRAGLGGQGRLQVCGAAFDGVGIPACIASGQAAAARVRDALGVGGH